MNTSTNIFDIVQKGFRVTVGAAATFVETIQDPQKREVTIADFRDQFQSRTEEWSEKGEVTEREARVFLEKIFQKDGFDASKQEVETFATEVQDSDLENEIQTLTEEITALKTELATLRAEKSDDN